jgi:hypothetical protein
MVCSGQEIVIRSPTGQKVRENASAADRQGIRALGRPARQGQEQGSTDFFSKVLSDLLAVCDLVGEAEVLNGSGGEFR